MMKKMFLILIILINFIPLTGCWSYKEIESLIIVAGVAIDKSSDGTGYHLTLDTVDLSGDAKESQPKSLLYESSGATIFDAARNAKKFAPTKFYWSNCQIIILSEELAREGIVPVMDTFMRNQETRDTIEVLVSKGSTAKSILTDKTIADPISSFGIDKILESDAQYLSTASYMQLNYIFNTLSNSGKSLVLPVVESVPNNQEPTTKVGGDAVFMKDRLIGFLSPEDTKYTNFVKNEVNGGIITGEIDGSGYTMEIYSSETKVSHQNEDGEIKIEVHIKTDVTVNELQTTHNYIDPGEREKLKENAEAHQAEMVDKVIKKVQAEFGADIFGFGEGIRKTDPKLWKEVKENWNEVFKNLAVTVDFEINIKNSLNIRTPMKVGE